jgi:hypothetical protein
LAVGGRLGSDRTGRCPALSGCSDAHAAHTQHSDHRPRGGAAQARFGGGGLQSMAAAAAAQGRKRWRGTNPTCTTHWHGSRRARSRRRAFGCRNRRCESGRLRLRPWRGPRDLRSKPAASPWGNRARRQEQQARWPRKAAGGLRDTAWLGLRLFSDGR